MGRVAAITLVGSGPGAALAPASIFSGRKGEPAAWLGIREFVERIQQFLAVCINICGLHGGKFHNAVNGCLYLNLIVAAQLVGNLDKFCLQSGRILSEHINPNRWVATLCDVRLDVANGPKEFSSPDSDGVFSGKLSGNSLGLQSPTIGEEGGERPTNDGNNAANDDRQPCTMIWVIRHFWWIPFLWLNSMGIAWLIGRLMPNVQGERRGAAAAGV